MYILPIFIKRYRSNIKAECFIKNIRLNTTNKYDKDGYIKLSNPRGLICRNELEKAIILKDKPQYFNGSGGTTAIFISDNKVTDELTITTIAYHDWAGTLWNLIFIVGGLYSLIMGDNLIFGFFIIAFILVMNGLDKSVLKRQKEFIEKTIANCEKE